MINLLASFLVLLAGLYLVGLGVVSLLSPARATRFLGGFASSAGTHYLEIACRLVAGGALLLAAPRMLFSGFFIIFGWILVATTVGLSAIPWRWHHRFARRVMPHFVCHLRPVAVASLVFGGVILASVILGGGAEP